MSTQTVAGSDPALIFNWRPSRRRKLSIISFLVASIALHALAFYIFQVVYPPAVALLPPPARVSVISPATDEGRVLLRWVEAEDPALGSATQRPPDTKAFLPPKVAHVPSFTTHQPALREVPPYAPDLSAPDPQPPGPVPRRRAPVPSPLPIAKTSIVFAPETAALGDVQLPEVHFTRSNKESPQAARFRVAISPRGDIRYCFADISSGDPALDEQARRYLAVCRFAGTPSRAETNQLLWTTADIVWGTDLSAAKEAP